MSRTHCHGSSVQQRRCRNLKGGRYSFDDKDSRVPYAALEIAHIGPVKTRPIGKLFLTPASFLAGPAQIVSEALADIHAENRYALSLIGLQTMSDVRS